MMWFNFSRDCGTYRNFDPDITQSEVVICIGCASARDCEIRKNRDCGMLTKAAHADQGCPMHVANALSVRPSRLTTSRSLLHHLQRILLLSDRSLLSLFDCQFPILNGLFFPIFLHCKGNPFPDLADLDLCSLYTLRTTACLSRCVLAMLAAVVYAPSFRAAAITDIVRRIRHTALAGLSLHGRS